ncbi:TlpA family protein disulfide reductase [Emticicia agri]|uniref:TlpA family protein disulfide reductase n=1 Tax=Emticicia agri TaxID=2492393 RepID=A0A4Q5LQK3_9BACT|nr:TlpA disulfide reductase family protein [Emticicia agri]RYU91761.1 TlpA family protein disulfide reductase [Emticicia agri]
MFKSILILLTNVLLLTNASGQTIIKGSFQSFPSTEFRIVYNQSALNDFQGEVLDKGQTNANGEFSTSFYLNSEQPVLLFISNQFLRLWAIPNTTLTVDETNKNKFYFSGQAAKQNNFLYQSGIMRPMGVAPMITSDSFAPLQQIAHLDSIEQRRWDLYKKSFAVNEVSNIFASYCKGEITHFSHFNKNQYILQNIYGQKRIRQEDIPSAYYHFWSKFELLNDSCLSDSYRNSVVDFIGYQATKRLHLFSDYPDREKYSETEFKIIDSLLADHPLTKERIKGEKLIFLINYFDIPRFVETQFENYKKEFPTSKYIDIIQKKWDKKNKITRLIPEFVLKDVSGKPFDIKSIRSKVVYIDFWGSWCKACLMQMPNSIQLQQRYKDKDVVFLFIDFYDTKENWLKAIKDKKITGLHVKAEKEDEIYFNEKFGIEQGFPRYALLDKKGVLITSSAPHPNDKELISLIDKYLSDK